MGQVIQIDEAQIRDSSSSTQFLLAAMQPAETYAFDKFVPAMGCINPRHWRRRWPYNAVSRGERRSLRWHRLRPGHDPHGGRKISRKELPLRRCQPPAACLKLKNFNVVIFSFNGIDAITTREDRLRCFAESIRVPRRAACSSSRHITQSCFSICRALDNAGLALKLEMVCCCYKHTPCSAPTELGVLSARVPDTSSFSSWGHTHLLLNAGTDRARRCTAGFQFLEAVQTTFNRQ